MKSFKFKYTLYSRLFCISYLTNGNKFSSFVFFLTLLISCNEVKPQKPSSYSVPKDYKEIKKFSVELKKENLRTMFLGAINFCSDVDYSKFLDNPRSLDEYKNGGNCCTSAVRTPYLNLAEYYVYAMDGDPSIWKNKDNPFKLKEVRKQWEGRIEKAKSKSKNYDSNSLTYLGLHGARVSTYDMTTEELKFMATSASIGFGGTQGDWHGTIDFRYPNGKTQYIETLPLASEKAEKLFKYFEDNNPRPNLPASKELNTIVTYALENPEYNDRLSQFIVRVKKVEFFYPNGWDRKIGEVTF